MAYPYTKSGFVAELKKQYPVYAGAQYAGISDREFVTRAAAKDPNVASQVDPGSMAAPENPAEWFGSLTSHFESKAGTPEALTPEALTAQVRRKYPVYDKVADDKLLTGITTKYPKLGELLYRPPAPVEAAPVEAKPAEPDTMRQFANLPDPIKPMDFSVQPDGVKRNKVVTATPDVVTEPEVSDLDPRYEEAFAKEYNRLSAMIPWRGEVAKNTRPDMSLEEWKAQASSTLQPEVKPGSGFFRNAAGPFLELANMPDSVSAWTHRVTLEKGKKLPLAEIENRAKTAAATVLLPSIMGAKRRPEEAVMQPIFDRLKAELIAGKIDRDQFNRGMSQAWHENADKYGGVKETAGSIAGGLSTFAATPAGRLSMWAQKVAFKKAAEKLGETIAARAVSFGTMGAVNDIATPKNEVLNPMVKDPAATWLKESAVSVPVSAVSMVVGGEVLHQVARALPAFFYKRLDMTPEQFVVKYPEMLGRVQSGQAAPLEVEIVKTVNATADRMGISGKPIAQGRVGFDVKASEPRSGTAAARDALPILKAIFPEGKVTVKPGMSATEAMLAKDAQKVFVGEGQAEPVKPAQENVVAEPNLTRPAEGATKDLSQPQTVPAPPAVAMKPAEPVAPIIAPDVAPKGAMQTVKKDVHAFDWSSAVDVNKAVNDVPGAILPRLLAEAQRFGLPPTATVGRLIRQMQAKFGVDETAGRLQVMGVRHLVDQPTVDARKADALDETGTVSTGDMAEYVLKHTTAVSLKTGEVVNPYGGSMASPEPVKPVAPGLPEITPDVAPAAAAEPAVTTTDSGAPARIPEEIPQGVVEKPAAKPTVEKYYARANNATRFRDGRDGQPWVETQGQPVTVPGMPEGADLFVHKEINPEKGQPPAYVISEGRSGLGIIAARERALTPEAAIALLKDKIAKLAAEAAGPQGQNPFKPDPFNRLVASAVKETGISPRWAGQTIEVAPDPARLVKGPGGFSQDEIVQAFEKHTDLPGQAVPGGLEKTAAKLKHVLDTWEYTSILDTANKQTRKVFKVLTGITLPGSIRGTKAVFAGGRPDVARVPEGDLTKQGQSETIVTSEGGSGDEQAVLDRPVGEGAGGTAGNGPVRQPPVEANQDVQPGAVEGAAAGGDVEAVPDGESVGRPRGDEQHGGGGGGSQAGAGAGIEGHAGGSDAVGTGGGAGSGRPGRGGRGGGGSDGQVSKEPAEVAPTDSPIVEPLQPESAQDKPAEASPAAKSPANGLNHKITDLDMFDQGGAKQKFQDNIAALRTLRNVMAEQRPASPDEQAVLAKFTGWGRSEFAQGLFAYYGETANRWEAERTELEGLLNSDELESAKRSTINAHYTTPRLADAMWRMAQRMGFAGGLVNEPAVGSGIFFGTIPGKLRSKSSLVASEMDTITGNIAKLLYPGARVDVVPYEDANLPDGFFDLGISNYPFANIKMKPDRYNKVSANLHDYFFLKQITTIRPGGLIVAITSTGTMDKASARVREELAKQADLVAAIRLPGGAFAKNAGTEVVTDIVILKKRHEGQAAAGPAWMELKEAPNADGGAPILVNEYFADHPEQILGKLDLQSNMYGKGEMHVSLTDDFLPKLEAAIKRLPANVMEPRRARIEPAREMIAPDARLKDFSFEVKDGKLWQRQGEEMVTVAVSGPVLTQAKGLLGLRDLYRDLVKSELAGGQDSELTPMRQKLAKAYDGYVSHYGPLHGYKSRGVWEEDPEWPAVLALEEYEPLDKSAKKADVFTKRTVKQAVRATKAEDIQQAVGISMNETGTIDATRIGALMGGKSEEAVTAELVKEGLVYRVPGGGLELTDYYLSGNVRAKLVQAEAAASIDKSFARNVDALRKAQPVDRTHAEIGVRLGSAWVPGQDYEQFFADMLDSTPGDMSARFLQQTGAWVIEVERDRVTRLAAFTSVWGTEKADFLDIVRAAISDKPIAIYKRISATESMFDPDKTAAANLKVEEVRDKFREWIWQDAERRQRLVRKYNDEMNNTVEVKHDGGWLEFPTMKAGLKPYPHQKAAVARLIHTRRMLAAHEVGAGKTLMYGMAAAKMKELGYARKPALVVLKANIEQVTDEIQRSFPTMKILSTNEEFTADRRQRTMARIATGDWDLVVMTHDNFKMLNVDPEVMRGFIRDEIRDLVDAITASSAEKGKKRTTTKRLEKMKLALEIKLKESLDSPRDEGLVFQQSGIDMLMVDEAHKFKSLPIYTARNNVKGIPNTRSERAVNMSMNIQWLRKNNPKAVIVMGTGTPVDNSMVEVYVWQKYLQPEELAARGIQSFDGWASLFGESVTELEPTVAGGYQPTTRFKRFVNLFELQSVARQMMDVVFAGDVPDIARPTRHDDVVSAEMDSQQIEYMAEIKRRADEVKKRRGPPQKGDDCMPAICTDGRKVAIHTGLVRADWKDNPTGKVQTVIRMVLEKHHAEPGVTQMIFSDMGVNDTKWGFNLYRYMTDKLVAGGIPRDKIIDFSKVKDGEPRLEAIRRLRDGDALIGIGGTDKLGTGVNAQNKLRWIWHVDAVMTPGRIEQRNGRGYRSGNKNKELGITYAVTKGTLDEFIWGLNKNKAGYIEAFLKGNSGNEIDWVDTDSLSPARVMAEASGNPDVINAIEIEAKLKKAEQKKRVFEAEHARHVIALDQARFTMAQNQKWMQVYRDQAAIAGVAAKKKFEVVVDGRKYPEMNEALAKALWDKTGSVAEKVGTHKIAAVRGVPLLMTIKEGVVPRYAIDLGGDPVEVGLGYIKEDETGVLSLIRSAEGTMRGRGGEADRLERAIPELETNITKLEAMVAKQYEGAEDVARLKREHAAITARMKALDQAGKAGHSDMDKAMALSDQYAEVAGPERAQRLADLKDKYGWTVNEYAKQLQKAIDEANTKRAQSDELPDAEPGSETKTYGSAPSQPGGARPRAAATTGDNAGEVTAPTAGEGATVVPPAPLINEGLMNHPAMVQLFAEVMGGRYPEVVRKIRGRMGTVANFTPLGKGMSQIKADQFDVIPPEVKDQIREEATRRAEAEGRPEAAKAIYKEILAETYKTGKVTIDGKEITGLDQPLQAMKDLAHEMGHAKDFGEATMTRGNVLGRIAGFVEYGKRILAKMPQDTGAIEGSIPTKVRDQLRRMAKKSGIPYQQLLAEHADQQGIVTYAEVMAELKALTRWWNPFDESKADGAYLKYRDSAEELYAEAVSVWLNAPSELEKRAPKFFSAFQNWRQDDKFNALYRGIMAELRNGEQLAGLEERILNEGFRPGEEALVGRDAARKLTGKDVRNVLSISLFDKAGPLLRLVNQAKKAGMKLEPSENPRYAIEEELYVGDAVELYRDELENVVLRPLKEFGLDGEQFGVYLLMRRISEERQAKANPHGIDPKTAREWMAAREKNTPEQWKALVAAGETFAAMRTKHVIDPMAEERMWNEILTEYIKNNTVYAKITPAEKIAEAVGRGTGARVFKQFGTLKPTANPFTLTVLQDLSFLVATSRNKSKRIMTAFAEKFQSTLPADAPRVIEDAETRWNGKHLEAIEPTDPRKRMVGYMKDGEFKGYYVGRELAAQWDSTLPWELDAICRLASMAGTPIRSFYTDANPKFWLNQLFMDVNNAVMHLPGNSKILLGRKAYLPHLIKNIPEAYRSVIQGKKGERTRDMLENKALMPRVQRAQGGYDLEHDIDRQLEGYDSASREEMSAAAKVLERAGRMWDYWTGISVVLDRAKALGVDSYLDQYYPDMPREEKASLDRSAANPMYMRRGSLYQIYNNMWWFSNANKEGLRAEYEAYARDPLLWWWKAAKYILLPKLIQYGIKVGLWGSGLYLILRAKDGTGTETKYTLQQAYDMIPQDELGLYNCFPIGLTPEGKVVYLRIPMGNQGRLMGGMIWRLAGVAFGEAGAMPSLVDYTAGVAPNVNALYASLMDVFDVSRGVMPRDEFRGTDAYDSTVFEARDHRLVEAVARRQVNNLGLGMGMFQFDTGDPNRIKGELEQFLSIPGVNVLGRFLKVTDRGITEKAMQARKEVTQGNARVILDAREAVSASLALPAGEQLSDDHRAALGKQPEYALHAIESAQKKRIDDPWMRQFLAAPTTKEKAVVWREWQEWNEKYKKP